MDTNVLAGFISGKGMKRGLVLLLHYCSRSSTGFADPRRILRFNISTNTENAIAKYMYPFDMCWWNPSAIKVKPINNRKLSASIFTVG